MDILLQTIILLFSTNQKLNQQKDLLKFHKIKIKKDPLKFQS